MTDQMTDQKRTLLTAILAAFAVVAVLAILLAQPRPDDPVLPGAESPASMAAQGNLTAGPDVSFPNPNIDTSVAATTTFADESATTTPVTAIYPTEDACKQATGTACHALQCENVPEGKSVAEICGVDFKPGWQALSPTPDRSAVPEIVAPFPDLPASDSSAQ